MSIAISSTKIWIFPLFYSLKSQLNVWKFGLSLVQCSFISGTKLSCHLSQRLISALIVYSTKQDLYLVTWPLLDSFFQIRQFWYFWQFFIVFVHRLLFLFLARNAGFNLFSVLLNHCSFATSFQFYLIKGIDFRRINFRKFAIFKKFAELIFANFGKHEKSFFVIYLLFMAFLKYFLDKNSGINFSRN